MRIDPELGPEGYKTYAIVAPVATHFRRATCAEVQCSHYMNGFKTVVPSDGPQAAYIRAQSGRRFVETASEGGLAEFVFPAGQQCFRSSSHRISLDREPLYAVREGDYRGNPRGIPALRMDPRDWLDSFANHQDAIATARKNG